MAVIPEARLDQIEFCESHVPVWQLAPNPTAIGLTAAQVTALNTATTNARKAYNDAQNARQAAKAATTSFYTVTKIMRDLAADYVRQIKAFAELQANPGSIFAAAQIPEPAAPTPATAPGKPTDINVTLESSGAVTISWEAENAAASTGGFFTITRKLPGQSGYTVLTGATGSTTQNRRMSFTDFTVPTSAAAAGVQYIIQGRRGTLEGDPSDAIIVQFGVDGSGFSVTGATAGAPMKMAA